MAGLDLQPTSEIPTMNNMSDYKKIQSIKEWFYSNFEDPVNSTLYESREGGYQYIWGGPYEIEEEQYFAFEGAVSTGLIEKAAQQILDEDGTWDWAPHSNRIAPDYDEDRVASGEIVDGDGEWPPVIPTIIERSRYDPEASQQFKKTRDVFARLDDLENALTIIKSSTVGIGHNHPPEPINEFNFNETDRRHLIVNISEIRIEINSSDPNIKKIEERAGLFRLVSVKIGKILSQSIDKIVVGGVVAIYYEYYPEIMQLLQSAYKAIMEWLPPLQLPF